MPRLICTFRRIIEILEAHGFTQVRHGASSHRIFETTHHGKIWTVTLAYHRLNDEAPIGTLKSIIRQSGLPALMFRK